MDLEPSESDSLGRVYWLIVVLAVLGSFIFSIILAIYFLEKGYPLPP